MNDKIKERVQAILCNYELDDDWFFPIAQENTKTGNVAEMDIKASKAYQYLLDHAKEITFMEFEEVFFVLMTTAYEYERNIETPAIQLLSAEVLHRTDAVFSQDKKDYLYQICKLMQKQFGAFLYFRDLYFRDSGIPKTKARILPLFTPSFNLEYWHMIKAYAEKALVSYPDGEIANRLVCISDVAVSDSVLFENFTYNRGKKPNYEKLEKYLDTPRKDFLDECFEGMYSEIPQPEFPLIKPNHDLNDHDDLVKNLNMFDDEVYQEVINNYLLRVLHHALVNPAILSFFGEKTNPVITNVKLSQTSKQLEKANNQKTEILNTFSHNCKYYLESEVLDDIAKSLLQMPNPELKKYSGSILLEYGSKKDLDTGLKIMKLQFQNDDETFKKAMQESIPQKKRHKSVTISDMLGDALRRCLLSLLYSCRKNEDNTKEYKWKDCFPDKNIETLQALAEQDIIFSENLEIVQTWYLKNLFPLEIQSYSESWNRLRLFPNSTASVVIVNLLTELIYNIFKYADKNAPVNFLFSDTDTTLDITLTNTIGNFDKNNMDSTKIGLSSAGSLKSVLTRTGQPIEHHPIENENTRYFTKISLNKALFFN